MVLHYKKYGGIKLNLLYKNNLKSGLNCVIEEGSQELDYLSLDILKLNKAEKFTQETKNNEVVLVILGGECSIAAENEKYENIGERQNVFDGKATAVYVPCKSEYIIEAVTEVEVAICKAKAESQKDVQLIKPADVKIKKTGKLNWQRDVHDIVSIDNTDAERIIVGETFNKPGNWSSYPPHRHDEDNWPEEVNLEEIYHFKIIPKQGFGIQKLYTDSRSIDETFSIEDGDTVILPEGYHPVAAAPGYELYYLWILAGKNRKMKPNDDPDHHWIKYVENIIE